VHVEGVASGGWAHRGQPDRGKAGCGVSSPAQSTRISLSTGSIAGCVSRPYWDLRASLRVASELGLPLELVMLPEWDSEAPPVTPYGTGAWGSHTHLSSSQVLQLVASAVVRVGSIHASRDIGPLLGAGGDAAARGARQLREAISVAVALRAPIVVVHAWDTYADRLDLGEIAGRVAQALPVERVPVELCVEGIPVSAHGLSPALAASRAGAALGRLAPQVRGVGLVIDLNWVSLAGDLEQWLPLCGQVRGVHVHGAISEAGKITPRHGNLDLKPLCACSEPGAVRRLSLPSRPPALPLRTRKLALRLIDGIWQEEEPA